MSARVPVFTVWHRASGPTLSMGVLTATARHHDRGRLSDMFDIRRPEFADDVLAALREQRPSVAVLLCSDYVWSLGANLDTARACLEHCPELLVVHGGPSAPAYPADAERFLRTHGAAGRVLVRGEGEDILCELLDLYGAALCDGDRAPVDRFAAVDGVSYLSSMGTMVRTSDRPRRQDYSDLPSAYLSGEFDDIPATAWVGGAYVEASRGCPYGCTFCDWGSATLSRLRMFPADRVLEEVRWLVSHGHKTVGVTDANFGITRRDVDIAKGIADLRREVGLPRAFVFCPAKNTVRNLTEIVGELVDAGIEPMCSLGLQSTDATTLQAVDRTNISLSVMFQVARELSDSGVVLPVELMLGLPGQTIGSLSDDLQLLFDRGMLVRTHATRVLPNSPMNEPSYRAMHQIVTDSRSIVRSTTSFTESEFGDMLRLVRSYTLCEHFAVLRVVLRYLQWDRAIPAMLAVGKVADLGSNRPAWPHLAWLLDDLFYKPAAPPTWRPLFDEIEAALVQLGVEVDAELSAVLQVQQFLLPSPGRLLPATMAVEHDVEAYLAWNGASSRHDLARPLRPLSSFGPSSIVVWEDPLGLCDGTFDTGGSLPTYADVDFGVQERICWELDSPLASTFARQEFSRRGHEFRGGSRP